MKLRYKIGGGLLLLIVLAVTALGMVISHTSECDPAPVLAQGTPAMKAVTARCYGSPDILEFADVEKPVPGEKDILIKVHAASVNPLDWHYMRGTPYVLRLFSGLGAPDDPRVGVDFSGTVEAVGKNVTLFQVGDPVFGGAKGSFAEYVTRQEDSDAIARKPDAVPHEQAAAIGIAGITALQAVRDHGKIKPGDRVLINGASGGVGTLAVQIAKHYGAEVTGVCSTRNLEMVRSIGADHVIDYKKDNYTLSEAPYDVIIDMVGNHSISDNRKVLKPEGKMVMVGGKKGNWIAPFVGSMSAALHSPFTEQEIGSMLAEFRKEDLDLLAELILAGELQSIIGSRFSLADAAEAIRHSEQGHAKGKIILEVSDARDGYPGNLQRAPGSLP